MESWDMNSIFFCNKKVQKFRPLYLPCALLLVFLTSICQAKSGDPHSDTFGGNIDSTNIEQQITKLDQLEKGQHLVQAGKLAKQIAMYYMHTPSIDLTIDYFDRAIQISKQTNDLKNLEAALEFKAELLLILERRREALDHFLQVYPLRKDTADRIFIAQNLASIGNCYRTLGQLDSALIYSEQALAHVPPDQMDMNSAHVFKLVAITYLDLGELDIALAFFMKSLKIFEKQESKVPLMIMLREIGVVLYDHDALEKAREFSLKALKLAKEQQATMPRAYIASLLGDIDFRVCDYESALTNYQDALEIYSSQRKPLSAANIRVKLSKIYIQINQVDLAINALEQSMAYYEANNHNKEIAKAKMQIGLAYAANGNPKEGLRLLEESRSITEALNYRLMLKNIYRGLAEVNADLENYHDAYFYNQLYSELQDSINGIERVKVIRELEAKYQVAKKEQNILELQETTSIQSESLKDQKSYIIALIIGVLSFFFLSIILYRNLHYTKLIAKQREEIDQHNIKELEKNKQLATMKAMIKGQEQERKRIARDLHDGLGGLLSTVKLKFDLAKSDHYYSEQSDAYIQGHELLDLACKEVRKIAHNMMPGAIKRFGLIPAVKDMCLALQEAQKIQVDFQSINWNPDLSEDLSINLYRIIQELLNNIIKHAEATEVIVQLAHHDNNIHLTVEDNGKGFNMEEVKKEDALGISSIQSRVNYLNGEMEFESYPNQGTTCNLVFPIKAHLGTLQIWAQPF